MNILISTIIILTFVVFVCEPQLFFRIVPLFLRKKASMEIFYKNEGGFRAVFLKELTHCGAYRHSIRVILYKRNKIKSVEEKIDSFTIGSRLDDFSLEDYLKDENLLKSKIKERLDAYHKRLIKDQKMIIIDCSDSVKKHLMDNEGETKYGA